MQSCEADMLLNPKGVPATGVVTVTMGVPRIVMQTNSMMLWRVTRCSRTSRYVLQSMSPAFMQSYRSVIAKIVCTVEGINRTCCSLCILFGGTCTHFAVAAASLASCTYGGKVRTEQEPICLVHNALVVALPSQILHS